MGSYYYIISNLPAENKDLEDGVRIVELSIGCINLSHGEGPFNSLRELTKSSKIYSSLKDCNPKRAQRIIEDRFIVKPKNLISYLDDGSEYLKSVYKIMQHSKNGKVDRSGAQGMHLFNSEKIKVIKITKPRNNFGIWEAIIEVYNQNSCKWIKKDKPTTFFPDGWDAQRLINECRKAFDEKVKLTDKKYIGKTLSGIPVIFIYERGELKSIYPSYE